MRTGRQRPGTGGLPGGCPTPSPALTSAWDTAQGLPKASASLGSAPPGPASLPAAQVSPGCSGSHSRPGPSSRSAGAPGTASHTWHRRSAGGGAEAEAGQLRAGAVAPADRQTDGRKHRRREGERAVLGHWASLTGALLFAWCLPGRLHVSVSVGVPREATGRLPARTRPPPEGWGPGLHQERLRRCPGQSVWAE